MSECRVAMCDFTNESPYDLHDCWGVYPQRGVEEAVVEQLLEQEVRVVRGASHQVLGQLQEGLKEE